MVWMECPFVITTFCTRKSLETPTASRALHRVLVFHESFDEKRVRARGIFELEISE